MQKDFICFSHLRWGFVYQRPQHLLSRFARMCRVWYVEEPTFHEGAEPHCDFSIDAESGVRLVVPRLPAGISEAEAEGWQQRFINTLIREQEIHDYVAWYYTPMALGFTSHLKPDVTVYDCMDELSAFKGAPPKLRTREAELFRRSSLVFTGGQSLYEVKRHQHKDVHAFPSSVDVSHFGLARKPLQEPADQALIGRPRVGYCGVIDERMDTDLVAAVADLRPDIHLVMLGPVVKVDPASLPQRPNLHYLGARTYRELPAYLAGWDAAMLPFAHNESTRYISPTKTPEYLAAAKPVISTSIRDVVRPYGEIGLVRIADSPRDFAAAIDAALQQEGANPLWRERVDTFLSRNSWDSTWKCMWNLILSRTEGSTEEAVA